MTKERFQKATIHDGDTGFSPRISRQRQEGSEQTLKHNSPLVFHKRKEKSKWTWKSQSGELDFQHPARVL
jgi:hypothetical protein